MAGRHCHDLCNSFGLPQCRCAVGKSAEFNLLYDSALLGGGKLKRWTCGTPAEYLIKARLGRFALRSAPYIPHISSSATW